MAENNTDNSEFFNDESIRSYVEELWGKVFEVSNQIIRDTKVFGFNEIDVIPDPNIHQMLATLAVASNTLDLILNMNSNGDIDIGDTRLVLNAKQQVLNMESIATALKSKDRSRYDESVKRLHEQAQI